MVGAYLAWVANDVWDVDPFVSAPAVFVAYFGDPGSDEEERTL